MKNLNLINKKDNKKDLKVSFNNPSILIAEFFNGLVIQVNQICFMDHKELVDQVSSNIFKKSGKIESLNSWLVMRNYLEQLDDLQLKAMLKEK